MESMITEALQPPTTITSAIAEYIRALNGADSNVQLAFLLCFVIIVGFFLYYKYKMKILIGLPNSKSDSVELIKTIQSMIIESSSQATSSTASMTLLADRIGESQICIQDCVTQLLAISTKADRLIVVINRQENDICDIVDLLKYSNGNSSNKNNSHTKSTNRRKEDRNRRRSLYGKIENNSSSNSFDI